MLTHVKLGQQFLIARTSRGDASHNNRECHTVFQHKFGVLWVRRPGVISPEKTPNYVQSVKCVMNVPVPAMYADIRRMQSIV